MRHRVLFSLPLLLVIGLTVNGQEGKKQPADLKSVLEGLPDAPEFTLVEGERTGPAPVEAVPPGDPQVLEPGAAKRLLDRLPALPEGGAEDFAKREGPPPPERTGETVDTPFPPPAVGPTPEAIEQGPLKVLRYQPEGEVPLVPRLSLTFSQPMIPVGSLDDLAQEAVPVRLEPQPPGSWRWIGTKTLLFEPEGERFPMSTEYAVTVPAGVKAQSGQALAEELSFRFATPTVKLESGLPRGNAVVEPTIVLRFNQRIDAEALLASISLEVAKESLPVRLATAEELDGLAVNDRCLVLRPQQPLPNDVQVQVHVEPGAVSAEGPRPTAARQTHSFRTFGPLQVVEHESGYNGRCPPGAPFKVRFNNQLDPTSIDESVVSFEPEIPHYTVRAYGQQLFVQGLTRANTRYTMTLAAGITDRFGQTLGAPLELEFQTTAPEPRLVGDWNQTLVLDPAGQPEFRVQSVAIKRLRVRVNEVDPLRDWRAARSWRQSLNRRNQKREEMPGEQVLNSVVEVAGDGLEWVETKVDLSEAIEGGLGHCLVLVESADETERRGWRQRLTPWIQGTHLGIDAMRESNQALVRVTRLSDGAPVEGAKVELFGDGVSTDANGLALLSELVPRNTQRELLIARKGEDVALLPGNWRTQTQSVGLRWFTFDDRHLYRPQEQVRIKGWVRRYDPAKGGDVLPLGDALPAANYQVRDARGREITKGRVELDAFGGFDLAFDLPDDAHVGHAYVRIGNHTHSFQIAEFRRPEFEVGVEPGSGGPHVFGDPLSFTGEATYFAGGGLPAASLSWSVRGESGDFTPPNCSGFRFGRYRPWWYRWHGGGGASHSEGFSARTDGTGKHTVAVDLKQVNGIGPVSLTATASVTDVNRQTWTGSSTVLVHPSRLYVGVRPQRPFVPEGKPLAVDLIAVDLDGQRVAGRPLTLTFERLDWRWVKGATEQFVAEQHTVEVTSGKAQVPAAVKEPAGGLWRVVAEVRDDAGRPNRTTLQIWVAGGQALSAEQVREEQVTLIPDKESYAPGETAKVLLVSPFSPAEALVTWRRSGVISSEVRKLEQATTVLEVPLTDDHVPGLTLHVSLVGAAPRGDGAKDRTRPAFAAGAVELEVPPTQRTLGVVATPAEDELAPGAHTSVDVLVTDPDGAPLPDAQVALCVVDEAVLFLADYTHPDPLSQFYAARGQGVSDNRSRHMLRLQTLAEASEEQSNSDAAGMENESGGGRLAMSKRGAPTPAPGAPMADGFAAAEAQGGGGGGDAPVALRKDLRALAVFTPAVRTDAQGKATVEFQLPDSLTRYRVVAMAADAVHAFGKGESTITARLPLMVRPSAPRFLNFGDRCELPVVLQNQTDAALEVQVGLRGANLDVERSAYVLQVPANDRREVRFPVAAAEAGTARVQVIASAGEASDAQELTFPVWTPATSEAFATYGVVDEGGVTQPVRPPNEVWSQFGGLEVTTSSTALQSLTDAVIYLVDYPYGCAEQVASRVIALAALRDVLAAFDAEGLPSAEALQAGVGRDLERLAQLQNRGDGGWGFWSAQDRSWPYLSIHVVHALALAKAKGYAVDERSLQRGFDYVRQIKRHIPANYSQGSKWALRAYALHVRAKLNNPAPDEALVLLQEAGAERLSLEALGWIYPLLRERSEGQAIRRVFGNTLRETAGAAHFVTSYEDGEHVLLHSARRVDGVVLEALLSDPAEAKGELAPKLVEGLLAHKKRGRWHNTQENAFVLLALDRYFRAAESVEPDFVARAWLGEAFAGEHVFRGRTTERARIDVPMAWLQEAGDSNLVLAKDGPGRLYYRIGMRYAPKSLDLDPLSAGFTVERGYEAVDDPADVSRDEDGTWRVKAGARVRVRVTMVAPSRRYHVALVDPLPAGLEPIDPGLPAMGSLPADPASPKRGGCWWWTRTWYEHSGLRDERAEAFTSYLWAGVHTYSYVTRATTPGEFVVPPAKAEEMYAPETFGRSATDKLVVVD